MSGDPSELSLERNLALFAGAGSGKTHGLITICLHLLAGARALAGPIPPSRLWLVTFTDKAAGEMRERLRQRVEALAHGAGEAQEPELRASFERLGRPMPPVAFWRGVLEGLAGATVTTFHSACAQLLRRAPAGVGLAPDFELLDEREAEALVRDCAERVVLDALADRLPGAAELCRDLEFGGENAYGLTGALVRVYAKLREEGLAPAQLCTGQASEARSGFDRALGELKAAVLEAMRVDLAAKKRFGSFLSRCAEVLERLRYESFWAPDGFPLLREAAKETKLNGLKGELRDALTEVKARIAGNDKDDRLGLDAYHSAVLAAEHEGAFLALLERLGERHRDALARLNALDFSGLLNAARDLLAAHPEFRRDLQSRIGALLVDEFQDTNRIQLELVVLLAERRAGGPRLASAEGIVDLPLEPGMLCAVGDRKQSIYEFRGADVSVFEALAAKIVAEGGARAALQHSWRSVPGLVEGINALFAGVMAPGSEARAYEVVFDPTVDALRPVRRAQTADAPIELLSQEPADTAEASREEEADRLATRLAQLIASGAPLVGERDGTLRPPRGGDIAILLRSFSALETYRQALMRHGLPHRVIRGRGFYGAQEVLDVASLLSVISDPSDRLPLAATLRSPWVALSDSSLIVLGTGKGGLSVRALGESPDRAHLPPEEQDRLTRFLDVVQRLRDEHERVGVRILLQLALERLPFREALGAAPFGEQALANLDKLFALADAWDRRRPGDLDGFARELVELASAEPREAQADAFDVNDPRAIQILTVHQSKGLEWPIVVVPNLAGKGAGWTASWMFDRTLGFALKVRRPDGSTGHTPRSKQLGQEIRRREAAESRRVLYVALTRARDRLILSGRAKMEANTWRGWLEPWFPEAEAAGQLARVVPEPRPVAISEGPSPTWGEGELEAAIARVRARGPAPVGELVLPVTQLELFAQCPRRYWLTHELGLREPAAHPRAGNARGLGRGEAQLRGTLAHRLLERVDFSLPASERRAALERIAAQEGLDPTHAEGQEVLGWVERFLGSALGRRLAETAPERIQRELPFMLRIRAGTAALCLKGQIDLMVEDDAGVTVLDYKTSEDDAKAETYAFQLACYALAARAWTPPGGAVRSGVVFLRAPRMEVPLRVHADLEAFEARVEQLGHALVNAVEGRAWDGRSPEVCRAISCGYFSRCHPKTAAL